MGWACSNTTNTHVVYALDCVFFVCCCCLSLAVIFKWEQLVCALQTCSSVCHYFSFFMQYINADITYVHMSITHTPTHKKNKVHPLKTSHAPRAHMECICATTKTIPWAGWRWGRGGGGWLYITARFVPYVGVGVCVCATWLFPFYVISIHIYAHIHTRKHALASQIICRWRAFETLACNLSA